MELLLIIGGILAIMVLMRVLRKKGIGGILTGASDETMFAGEATPGSRVLALFLAFGFAVLSIFLSWGLFRIVLTVTATLLLAYAVGFTAPLRRMQTWSSGRKNSKRSRRRR